jgi:hypothetical protein
VFKVLSPQAPKSTEEVAEDVRKLISPRTASISEVFDILLQAETTGHVKRVRNKGYDETRPVSTISWQLTGKSFAVPQVISPLPYIERAVIVVSQPIYLTTQHRINLMKVGAPVLSVREAMEKVVMDAKKELMIACPYYDELFIDVLSVNIAHVAKLRRIAVLAEVMDPILVKSRRLFPNMKIKTLLKTAFIAERERPQKIHGVHAKIMIADRSEVLIGSFNFRFSHIHYNVDLGLLASGRIAEDYAKIYDSIWRLET